MLTDEGEPLEIDVTPAQCVECGTRFTARHLVGMDPFTFPCPHCGSRDSLPTGFEAALLQDPEDWTDEEMEILY